MARYIDAELLVDLFEMGVNVHDGLCNLRQIKNNIDTVITADVVPMERIKQDGFYEDAYNPEKVKVTEAIQASMGDEAFRGLLKGNTMRYLWRYEKKGKPLEDLKKARWYLNRLIGEVEKEND